jgi:uncharacterized zinc-type alcohol dehydrogenase-like protein
MNSVQRSRETIGAYAALGIGQPLQPYRYAPKELAPNDVEIAVTHCGMCHTDLHLANNDFGISAYPFVPGHEIVGHVSQLGSAARAVSLGQRVGVGWLAGACFACDQCDAGKDNICPSGQPTCVGHEGGYATHVRVDARFAFPIPEALPSETAAPLFCAGITVFAPLIRHATGKSRVGVIGIGGLGHLALQYARALGCHVTAFSTSARTRRMRAAATCCSQPFPRTFRGTTIWRCCDRGERSAYSACRTAMSSSLPCR